MDYAYFEFFTFSISFFFRNLVILNMHEILTLNVKQQSVNQSIKNISFWLVFYEKIKVSKIYLQTDL